MRVLVAGAGAVGQWLGGRLLQDGHDTTLLCRAEQAAAINGPGLFVRGHTTLHGHPKAVTEVPPATDPFEVILLTCKAHQTAPLAAAVAPHLKAGGVLASLQNGLGNGQKLLRSSPSMSQVALALTSHGLTLEGPGRVHHAGLGPTLVGPLEAGSDQGARVLFGLLARVGLDPQWRDDMQGPVWRKALVNHAINPVAALHGVLNGDLVRRPALHAQCLAVLAEGEEVARRAGIDLGGDSLAEAFGQTVARTAANACSMLQDVRAKRPTEVEQITGRIVRLGEGLKVPVAQSADLYRRLKDLEASYLGGQRAHHTTRDEAPFEAGPAHS
ncbi:MAG TPA: ketopantoate reductase family protein [Candidatus Thermoplasmatota archaeon]|nr:ketopantoate reductase family protein [Candidatus Thermoplasmatota archaeon]